VKFNDLTIKRLGTDAADSLTGSVDCDALRVIPILVAA
jgi:hypothetical protein